MDHRKFLGDKVDALSFGQLIELLYGTGGVVEDEIHVILRSGRILTRGHEDSDRIPLK